MFKKYLNNTSGNFGIMFGLAATGLLMGVGVAVDFAGMTSQRQKLQNYIDAAVLAAATSETKDLTELQKVVDERIALMNIDGWDISAPVSIVGDDVVIDASSKYSAVLMGPALKLLGNDTEGKMKVGASTAAPFPQNMALNIALVLDTTDSMAGSNIDALKEAAEDLLTDLEGFGDGVNVSIVPFGQYVNIESHKGAAWLDTSQDGASVAFLNEPVETKNVITPSVCTPTGNIIPGKAIIKDGVNVGYRDDIEEKTCTAEVLGDPTTTYRSYYRNYTWYGCAGSRLDPDNVKVSYDGVQIPGVMEQYYTGDLTHVERSARCGDEMMPLNNNFLDMKALIRSLTTSGETYLPSGLLWGWRALSPSVPFTESASSAKDTTTVMIFMTDGFNTRSQEEEYHDGWNQEAGVNIAADLCKNIKDENINVFTVAYNMPTIDDANTTRNMLKKCASHPKQSFDPKDAAELKATFKDIVSSLQKVRLKYRET